MFVDRHGAWCNYSYRWHLLTIERSLSLIGDGDRTIHIGYYQDNSDVFLWYPLNIEQVTAKDWKKLEETLQSVASHLRHLPKPFFHVQ